LPALPRHARYRSTFCRKRRSQRDKTALLPRRLIKRYLYVVFSRRFISPLALTASPSMAESQVGNDANGASYNGARLPRSLRRGQLQQDHSGKPYNFTLKENGDDNRTNVDWLTCCLVVETLLDSRTEHLRSLLIPEYNVEFLLVVSDYFKDFQFPASIKVRLWWSAEDGDTLFRAHLLRQFRDGKTGLDAIIQTIPGCNLEDHCRTLRVKDPETANILYLAIPRAIDECESLRRLLSPQAKDLIAQEDEDRRALSRDNQPIMDLDSRRNWEVGVEHGF
ncbi:hypothetical protein CI238_13092, partial [Colletotrichum incanum]